MRSEPIISVIMPVYNSARYLEGAVQSILDQTLADFELIIVDDGSNDESPQIVQSLAARDPRIVALQTPENGGSAKARNFGIRKAQAPLIAIMDSDDIALPDRLARQVKVMQTHPECILCASSTDRIDSEGNRLGTFIIDFTPAEYRWCIAFNLRITHSSLVFRASMPDGEPVLYSEPLRQSQDFELVSRLAIRGDVICLSDVLVQYRVHSEQVTATQTKSQRQTSLGIARAFQANQLPSDVCAALEPVNKAMFETVYDFPAITAGLKTYTRHMAAKEDCRLDHLAATELHFLLARTTRSQIRALLSMLTLAPEWIPTVVMQKTRRVCAKFISSRRGHSPC